jgi:uncharacterized repeat protein (TIGR03803 family)
MRTAHVSARWVNVLPAALLVLLSTAAALSWASGQSGVGTESLVHTFNGTRGQNGNSALIFDSAGNLYGTTAAGGFYGGGIAYELSPNGTGGWTLTVLHNFGNTKQNDGIAPQSGLIFDALGNLYGTTYQGGTKASGIVYQLSLAAGKWSEAVLHNFGATGDGVNPVGGVVFDSTGNLYGTTFSGGAYSKGTAYKLTPSGAGRWSENVIWNFGNGFDAANPNGGLVTDSAGNFYGTSANGGFKNYGEVFELLPVRGGWNESDLHDFGHFQDGLYPLGTLLFDSAGNLYGTTSAGGTRGYGTVFELASGSWTETILHNFTSGNDGWQPDAEQLAFDKSGNLFGTTLQGGASNAGIVFELSPAGSGAWTETLMHAFNGGTTDGAAPVAGVVVDSSGNLYGATNGGGTDGFGIVYKIVP